MTHIHLDAVGGIAGDMFVAAMLDALPRLKALVLADAAAVLPPGVGEARLAEGDSGGIRALRFGLAVTSGNSPHADGSFAGMVKRIEAAPLAPGTAAAAVALLTILAEAEATVHRVPVDAVHFHEIADWDSLLDMVAAGSIVAALGDARWTVSPLPRGGGLAETAHGRLPVPAPATALILAGFEWRDDGIGGERVTPTGAAILKHVVTDRLPGTLGRLAGSGSGAGTRALPGIPNILRAMVFEDARQPSGDRVTMLAFEVDDMTGEEIAVAADRLRGEAGVLDLSIGERWGKKGRPMHAWQLIVRPNAVDAVIRRCFAETSTIGLRVSEETRVVLARDRATVGDVDVKSVFRPGVGETRKAESDTLRGEDLASRRTEKHKAESET